MGNLFSSTTNTTTSILHRMLNVNNDLTIEKNAFQDLIAADVIAMDELITNYAEYRNSHGKAIGILRSSTGITSIISSSIFIWMILRSHEHLSTTQHRLLLGLCISDIIYSLSWSTFNVMAPSDTDYFVWNARGNQATCNTQGFFAFLGAFGGLFYNVSLNLYFLAVVKYNKSDKFIRAKIEPFLHGVPLATALCYSIYRLVKKQLNANNAGNCVFPANGAPHCIGYNVGEVREGFDIPCWQGIDGSMAADISAMVLILIPALIMIVSLGMIKIAVRTQEKKLAKYGVGALRSNLQQQPGSTQQQLTVNNKQSSGVWGRMSTSLSALSASLKSRTLSFKKTNEPVTRSNSNTQSQSRAVMRKAYGYTSAWFLSYGFYIIRLIILLATGSSPLVLGYLNNIFGPLQGLFNLLIFMHPKIMTAKKSKQGRETVSWCKALSIAFWSKGKGVKKHGTRRSNLHGGRIGHPKKTRNEDTMTNEMDAPTFGMVKKTKKKRAKAPQEEEKCEIQVPDNLSPNKMKEMYSVVSTATYARNNVPSTETSMPHARDPAANDMEDPDEDAMLNQDEEEETEEIEEEMVDKVPVATGGPVSADVKEQKEISMENQDFTDEMNVDDDSELASMNITAGGGELKEKEG